MVVLTRVYVTVAESLSVTESFSSSAPVTLTVFVKVVLALCTGTVVVSDQLT